MQTLISNIKSGIWIAMIALLMVSCNSSKKNQEEIVTEDEIAVVDEIYRGDFIYADGAAVLAGNSFIYGVEINSKAKELTKKVEAIKTSENDIVSVTVQGKVTSKAEGTDGWDEIITITNIIDVDETPVSVDIEL